MQDFPETRHSLLIRVQQDDPDAWVEFSKIYRPLIYRIARRRGWQAVLVDRGRRSGCPGAIQDLTGLLALLTDR